MSNSAEKKILVYNNNTGVATKMNPLFAGEGLELIVAENYFELISTNNYKILPTSILKKRKNPPNWRVLFCLSKTSIQWGMDEFTISLN